MMQESFKGHAGDPARFYPTYRYEPYTTQFALKNQELYSVSRFTVDTSGNMGNDPVPTETQHPNVQPIHYRTNAQRVWESSSKLLAAC